MRRMKRRQHPLAPPSPPPLASTYPILHLKLTWRPRTTQASGGILVDWKSEVNIKIITSDIMHLEKKKKKNSKHWRWECHQLFTSTSHVHLKWLTKGVSSIVCFYPTCAHFTLVPILSWPNIQHCCPGVEGGGVKRSIGEIVDEDAPVVPKKKKYAKEAWPGMKFEFRSMKVRDWQKLRIWQT